VRTAGPPRHAPRQSPSWRPLPGICAGRLRLASSVWAGPCCAERAR
jgi:hypothetical protein